MEKIRFIINPKSGIGKSGRLTPLIRKSIDAHKYNYEIRTTDAPGHATELALEAVTAGFSIVAAVGGDGSVNEVASALTGTTTSLAIIPTGSGNGMARHLHIPVNVEKSIRVINSGSVDLIDTVRVNGRFCIGTIGIGFDAHIAHLFANAGKRGYSTYVRLVLTEFYRYREKKFSILVDDVLYEKECFLLTFANSSQFGNNAVIAPRADVKDGIIDVSMMSRFPVYIAPALIYRLMNNSIAGSKYFQSSRGRKILVKNNSQLQGHIDGEPVNFDGDLSINIDPLSLRVMVPSTNFKK